MERNVDQLTLELLASALLPGARLQGVRAISVQSEAGLLFELRRSRNVVVPVFEDAERFYFLIGKHEASIEKRDLPLFGGKIH